MKCSVKDPEIVGLKPDCGELDVYIPSAYVGQKYQLTVHQAFRVNAYLTPISGVTW